MSVRWEDLRRWTQARIGLDRAGHAISTRALLDFQYAHARARDAVHRPWEWQRLAQALSARGEPPILVRTAADTRTAFLQRPDLGRELEAGAAAELRKRRGAAADIAFSVSDGLSAAAIDAHFLPLWEKIETALKAGRLTRFPLVLVPFGRVAVGDAIGEALGAKLSVIFIGERPGLTSADSLGIYLTYQPRRGTPDASRNCLSNIRPPEGMGYELASEKLLYYVRESLRRQISGVTLKEGPPALGT